MARIRGIHTKPERVIRSALHQAGFRFRLHRRDLPGRPDVLLPKYHAAIQVYGCFWHQHAGCVNARLPGTRPEFWAQKFRDNQARDLRQEQALMSSGWRLLVVWECALRKEENRITTIACVERWIKGRSCHLEIPAK